MTNFFVVYTLRSFKKRWNIPDNTTFVVRDDISEDSWIHRIGDELFSDKIIITFGFSLNARIILIKINIVVPICGDLHKFINIS